MSPVNTLNARRRNVRTKKHGDGYDEQAVFFYLTLAGGCVNKAFVMAAGEGDKRVPRDRGTWYSCVERCEFKKRYEEEAEKERQEFHERIRREHQHILNETAEAFRKFQTFFCNLMDQLSEEIDRGNYDALKLLSNGSPYSIGNYCKLFRTYLRAMGEPEKIIDRGQCSRPITTLTYEDLEKRKR